MPAPKTPEGNSGKTAAPNLPKVSDRKPWKKKTPVEVVLEQAEKLKAEIAEGEEELKGKRKQLEKFEQAKKLFEGA
jgi:hypothetical protein